VKKKEKKKTVKDKELTPKEEKHEETGVKTKTKVKKTKEDVTTKKPKETITAVVDKELELLEKEIEKAEVELEKAKAHDAEAQAKEYFKQKYEWISHPWMFSAPPYSQKVHFESWKEDWGNLLLDWAKYFTKHIVSLMELKDQYPYYNGDIKRSLSEEDLRSIMEFLIARDLAKWVSKEETRLRVYWRSLEAWADIIYEWIIEAWAQDSWVITLIDLVRAKQSFSTIPPKELGEIMKIMIEKGYATKVDEKAIEISF
jgi:ESCRT-II complex subunit VPS25